MSERPKPFNREAEQSALGAALQNEAAMFALTERLSEEDFFDRAHAAVFTAIAELSKAGSSVDAVTTAEMLKRHGRLEAIGGGLYLTDLISAVPATGGYSHYIDIVRSHSTRRKLIDSSEDIIRQAYDGEDEAEIILDNAENAILQIGNTAQKNDFRPVGDVVEETRAAMEELSNLPVGSLTGLDTGFTQLNRITNGFQKKDLIVLAARPSQGKTSLALNIALNAAMKVNTEKKDKDGAAEQAVVMIFSLEMPGKSIVQRLLSLQSGIEAKEIFNGQALKDSTKARRLAEAFQAISETKIIIDDNSTIQIGEMWNKCRRLIHSHGKIDLIIIDYLQLMDMGGSAKSSSKPENRQQEIATLTRMLKHLANKMDCPVLLLSQVTRESDKRSHKEHYLSDLRESGAIEQDADIVMFVYEESHSYSEEAKEGDAMPDDDRPDPSTTRTLSIAKHRNGETGKITLRWLGKFMMFGNYNKGDDIMDMI